MAAGVARRQRVIGIGLFGGLDAVDDRAARGFIEIGGSRIGIQRKFGLEQLANAATNHLVIIEQVKAWTVPGYESSQGTFSNVNPAISPVSVHASGNPPRLTFGHKAIPTSTVAMNGTARTNRTSSPITFTLSHPESTWPQPTVVCC